MVIHLRGFWSSRTVLGSRGFREGGWEVQLVYWTNSQSSSGVSEVNTRLKASCWNPQRSSHLTSALFHSLSNTQAWPWLGLPCVQEVGLRLGDGMWWGGGLLGGFGQGWLGSVAKWRLTPSSSLWGFSLLYTASITLRLRTHKNTHRAQGHCWRQTRLQLVGRRIQDRFRIPVYHRRLPTV